MASSSIVEAWQGTTPAARLAAQAGVVGSEKLWQQARQWVTAEPETGAALCARLFAPEPWATGIGGVLAVVIGIHCLRTLLRHAGNDRIARILGRARKLLPKL